MSAAQKFLLYYILLIVACASGLYYWNAHQPAEKTHDLSWVIFGFVAFMTGAVHLFLLNAGKNDPKVFIRSFMAATSVKLFLYLAVMVLYAISVPEKAYGFIFHFLVFYLIFTAFEVIMLYLHFRPKK
ncbi:MAG: hypothetical protein Fur0041_14250 [Bacteroidia bacterium]